MADVKPLVLDSGIIKQIATGDTLGVANGGTGVVTLTDNGVLIGNGTGAIDVTAAGTTGQVLTGVTGGNPTFQDASLPSSFVGKSLSAYKTADESISSSTAYQDDDALNFAIGANENWSIRISLRVTASSGGIKVRCTVPSGATGNIWAMTQGGVKLFNGVLPIATGGGQGGVPNDGYVEITGYVVNSSTAGTVQFQWAQFTSGASATIVYKGSILTAIRVS